MIWFLSFIPYYVYVLLIIISIVAYFYSGLIKFDYGLNIDTKILRIVSIILFSFSTFMLGYSYNEKVWKEKIINIQDKVKESEQQSKDTNVIIQEKLVYRDKIIKEKSEEIIKYIDRYVDKEIIKTLPPEEQIRYKEIITYVENCPIPKEFIKIHNQAAVMEGLKK